VYSHDWYFLLIPENAPKKEISISAPFKVEVNSDFRTPTSLSSSTSVSTSSSNPAPTTTTTYAPSTPPITSEEKSKVQTKANTGLIILFLILRKIAILFDTFWLRTQLFLNRTATIACAVWLRGRRGQRTFFQGQWSFVNPHDKKLNSYHSLEFGVSDLTGRRNYLSHWEGR
jgi:hypothetical protein